MLLFLSHAKSNIGPSFVGLEIEPSIKHILFFNESVIIITWDHDI